MKRTLPKRKLAEWITLVTSIVVILSLVVYLVHDLLSPASPYVEILARPAYAEVSRAGSRYVLPIDIESRADRAVARVNVRIAQAGAQPDDVEIQYLGKRSTVRIYRYLDQDPRTLKIEIAPTHYVFD